MNLRGSHRCFRLYEPALAEALGNDRDGGSMQSAAEVQPERRECRSRGCCLSIGTTGLALKPPAERDQSTNADGLERRSDIGTGDGTVVRCATAGMSPHLRPASTTEPPSACGSGRCLTSLTATSCMRGRAVALAGWKAGLRGQALVGTSYSPAISKAAKCWTDTGRRSSTGTRGASGFVMSFLRRQKTAPGSYSRTHRRLGNRRGPMMRIAPVASLLRGG